MKPKIIICLNTAWNLVNFRAGLVRALIASGYEVVVIAPPDEYVENVKTLGCRFIALKMDNRGINPFKDLLLLFRIRMHLKLENPAIFLAYTIKPNIYGSLAAHSLKIPVINNIAGLGVVFSEKNWLTHVVIRLYRIALEKSQKVFFQNTEDLDIFLSEQLITHSQAGLLPGSGVDIDAFYLSPLPSRLKIRFLLIARMLWEKGIGEFVEAAHILRKRGVDAEFFLLGFLDVKNPRAISRAQMDEWIADGVVNYLGISNNVGNEIDQADCIVLPSFYREGTPRSLLEAAAMGRPIVTTDSIGCRDVVDDGVNGFLCESRNARDLADKMERVALLSPIERVEMGRNGRKKIEREFDEKIVIKKYLEIIKEILTSQMK